MFCPPISAVFSLFSPRPPSGLVTFHSLASAASSNGASVQRISSHQRAFPPNINTQAALSEHLRFPPPTSTKINPNVLNPHQQWPAARESLREASPRAARSALMTERSSRATPARLVSRLVLRKSLFCSRNLFFDESANFGGLERYLRALYAHPAMSRHQHQQHQIPSDGTISTSRCDAQHSIPLCEPSKSATPSILVSSSATRLESTIQDLHISSNTALPSHRLFEFADIFHFLHTLAYTHMLT